MVSKSHVIYLWELNGYSYNDQEWGQGKNGKACAKVANTTPKGIDTLCSLLDMGLYPICMIPPIESHHNIQPSYWPELIEQHKDKSLRELAREYGVSHEAVRRTLAAGRATS